jgi:rubrerythrin
MMKLLLVTLLCLLAAFQTSAFAPRPAVLARPTPALSTTTSLNVFGNKKSAAAKAARALEEEQYWQGEWVCKDCGYIYQRVRDFSGFLEL